MADILRHDLVLLQLLEEGAAVEGEDVLEVAKDEALLPAQGLRHPLPARPHRQQEAVEGNLKVLKVN